MTALLAQGEGDLARAEILLTEALETARSLRSPYLQILYQGNLSGVYADGKRWIHAVAVLLEALRLVRNTGNRHFGTGVLLLTACDLPRSRPGGRGDAVGCRRWPPQR